MVCITEKYYAQSLAMMVDSICGLKWKNDWFLQSAASVATPTVDTDALCTEWALKITVSISALLHGF